jgi:dTDP-L-rhamnose 4-epimerase
LNEEKVLPQQSVLITGGAGFIGSHLVDALVEQGHKVRVFDNLEPQVHGDLRQEGRWPEYCNPDAEYILGDVRDREALQKAMRGVDVIFHEAAMVGVGQSMYQVERYMDVNTRGTAVLLDILVNDEAIRQRVRKLVVASSMSIYGEGSYACPEHGLVFPRLRSAGQLAAREWELFCPEAGCERPLAPRLTDEEKPLHATSIYAISKKDQEEMCLTVGHTYGIPTVALRYFNTYGSRQALANPYTGVAAIFSGRLLNNNRPVIFEDGRQTRDFVHVSDVVQANLLAMTREEMNDGVFNVGTGRSVSILEVAEALIEHLGSTVQPEVVAKFRAGDIRHCVADTGRLAAQGYQAQVPFVDGVAGLVDWVRKQQAADTFEEARKELVRRGLAV